jgi:hypothetical protein
MKTLDCRGCGATLDVSTLAPGTEFSCGGCGAGLKVPASAATAKAAKPAAKAAPAAAPAAPARARSSRRREPEGDAPPAPKRNVPLLVGAGAGVLLLAGVGWLALRPDPKPPEPPPAPIALRPKTAPAKVVPPEEAEWAEAKTREAQEAVARKRMESAMTSDEASKELYRFLLAKSRFDLAKEAARARLGADPENAWANESLGRVNAKPVLDELAARAADLDSFPVEGWDRVKKRIDEKRWWVEPDEKKAWEADLAVVRRQAETLADPWYKDALAAVAEVRGSSAYKGAQPQGFEPVDFIVQPPYLVMAQRQMDSTRHATVNVLGNHSKFFKCLTGEFLKIMKEAGLATPTVKEMGNPVLKAFVFTERSEFDRWHMRQGGGVPDGVRAYYAWGSNQYMMMYDTGASAELQNNDTCVAFHEATHQLVHYYRHYYLTQEERKKDPGATIDLRDGRLHGSTHWFQEGFAEFFGAADRISSQTGEWRLLRPHLQRLGEWGDPVKRKAPQWTLQEVIEMKNSMQLGMLAARKQPDAPQAMVSLYYAQAWALNHYLYYGNEGKYREKYLKVIHEEMNCRSGSDVFYACMGAGQGEDRKKWIEELQDEIYDHVRRLLKPR